MKPPNLSNFEYQVGGSLSQTAPSYVLRQADYDFYQSLKAGNYCYVLNSRQMGKSSLRVRTMQKLTEEGIICGFIDLTGIGTEDITPQKWYAGMVQMLVKSCQLDNQWRGWWRERRDILSPVQCFAQFVEEILLNHTSEKIVIFIDEIDYVLSQHFSLDEFFAYIRFCWQQRQVNPDYHRLTFALLGVASPSDLIQDKTHTPFNIGNSIQLQGFQIGEVQPLIIGLAQKWDNAGNIMREILDFTGGQPFLTQKLCQLMLNPLERLSVSQVVQQYIIDNWESRDEPEHLRTIRDRLLINSQQSNRILGLYRQVLQGHSIKYDSSPEHQALRLSSLVVEKKGHLAVYNPIYAEVFNLNWVEQQLANLRPYTTQINRWLASNCQDKSCLLQGERLQDALTWSLGKSLSNEDYQFLNASQQLAKQEIEQTLTATQQASYFLAKARRKAEEDTRKYRLNWRWFWGILSSVTVIVIILRSMGLLQGLEWDLYDQFMRYRPLESPDSRIVIVTIDDDDIETLQQWPISDSILAETLQIIKNQNPRVIGLDIYRNLPVSHGLNSEQPLLNKSNHTTLTQILKSTPNLYGIEKIVKPRISASSILKEQNQVGFADHLLDNDGKVRRALLSIESQDEGIRESLAVKLASHYLLSQNIQPEMLDNGQLKWGKTIFKRFNSNDGGYVKADEGGYQILINYRGETSQFLTISLQDVLTHQFPKDIFQDKIVLIGSTAESLHDFFFTPYNSSLWQSSEQMSGVILHANIISYVLSSVLEERPLINTWNETLENLWILIWGFIGSVIGWILKEIKWILILSSLSALLLLGISYFAFLQGWWIPIIPCLLVYVTTMMVMIAITIKKIEKQKIIATLKRLSQMSYSYPISQNIAVESLKNSVNKQYLSLIKTYFPNV